MAIGSSNSSNNNNNLVIGPTTSTLMVGPSNNSLRERGISKVSRTGGEDEVPEEEVVSLTIPAWPRPTRGRGTTMITARRRITTMGRIMMSAMIHNGRRGVGAIRFSGLLARDFTVATETLQIQIREVVAIQATHMTALPTAKIHPNNHPSNSNPRHHRIPPKRHGGALLPTRH